MATPGGVEVVVRWANEKEDGREMWGRGVGANNERSTGILLLIAVAARNSDASEMARAIQAAGYVPPVAPDDFDEVMELFTREVESAEHSMRSADERTPEEKAAREEKMKTKNSSRWPDMCTGCGKVSAQLKKCGGCKILRYCSKECQSRHWKERHRPECLLVKQTVEARVAAVEAREFLGGAAEKEAALDQTYFELWSMFGVPQRSDTVPKAFSAFPRGNSLIPLMQIFTVSMQIDAGPWPAHGPNAPYDASADDVVANPVQISMPRGDGARSLQELFMRRKKWMDRLRNYITAYLVLKVPKERWPEAAGEYHEVGVTPAALEVAREMEPHVMGSVLIPLLGEDYVPRWWVASRM